MIGKIKTLFASLITSLRTSSKDGYENSLEEITLNTINTNIEINILWEDIINGIPNSETDCSIAKAAKRDGYADISVSDHSIAFSDGTVYFPLKFSDHWKSFIGSSKLKPLNIVYSKAVNY